MKIHYALCWVRDSQSLGPCDCPTAHKWRVERRYLGWVATNGVYHSTHKTWWQAYTRATLAAERDANASRM